VIGNGSGVGSRRRTLPTGTYLSIGCPCREVNRQKHPRPAKATSAARFGAVLRLQCEPGHVANNSRAAALFEVEVKQVDHIGNRPDVARPVCVSSDRQRRPQPGSTRSSGKRLRRQSTGHARRRPQPLACTDGTNEVTRDVLLNVYEGNQPPRLMDVHNRIPVLVTLPHSETLLRGGAFDLEGDILSFKPRYSEFRSRLFVFGSVCQNLQQYFVSPKKSFDPRETALLRPVGASQRSPTRVSRPGRRPPRRQNVARIRLGSSAGDRLSTGLLDASDPVYPPWVWVS